MGVGRSKTGHFRFPRNGVMRMWTSASNEFRFADFDAHRSASSRMLFVFIISPLQASARRGSPVNSDSLNLRYSMPMRRLRSPAVKSSHTRFSAR